MNTIKRNVYFIPTSISELIDGDIVILHAEEPVNDRLCTVVGDVEIADARATFSLSDCATGIVTSHNLHVTSIFDRFFGLA